MHEELPSTVQNPQAAPVPLASTAPTAAQMYQAARNQVRVIQDQLSDARSTRNRITGELTNDQTQGADRSGLEARLKTVDGRIADLDKALASAQSTQSAAAGVPGAMIDPNNTPRDHSIQPDDAAGVAAAIFTVLAFPLVIAYARRIWRRSAKVTVTLPPEMAARMQAMEEAIESVAVEVERIGEGQRFMTQALAASPRGIGAGAAEPIMVRSREAVHAERPL
ncbi:MAG: hypothetical protein ABJB66_02960 [Gemmatimonadaceae bacterium]